MTYLLRPTLLDELMVRGGMTNPLDRMFAEAPRTAVKTSGFNPALNVYEDSTHYYVLGVLPGIEADKLDISVKENVLTISGEYNYNGWPQTNPATENNSGQTVRTLLNEISQGKFVRQLKLAAAFDSDKIEARYENGLLKLTLPKSESNQPKRISVTTSTAPELSSAQV